MEKNHKNTDCYFFYYSTCTKGDSCAYRHEPAALGSETVCQYWQQGSCHNQHCNYRHMEIKKNRKIIPCYWEKFPAGCKKPHCPFLHKQNRSNITNPIEPAKVGAAPVKSGNQEWTNRPDGKFDGNSGESEQPGRGNSEASSFIGSPVVDPLIVNFEEESDNESASSKIPSPTKMLQKRTSSCKTYEQIRLEETAEEADFYSYGAYQNSTGGGKIKSAVLTKQEPTDGLNFEILSLDEIRKRKKNRIAEEKKEENDQQGPQSIRDVLKSLDHLRDVHTSRKEFKQEIHAKRKISFTEIVEGSINDERIKKIRVQVDNSSKVAPIRLRRTRKTDISSTMQVGDEKQEKANDSLKCSLSTKENVEIRVCDSSTDSIEQGTRLNDTDSDKIISQISVCDDSGQISNSKEFNTLESTSDDILKDIDALLTDNHSS